MRIERHEFKRIVLNADTKRRFMESSKIITKEDQTGRRGSHLDGIDTHLYGIAVYSILGVGVGLNKYKVARQIIQNRLL